LLGIAGSSCSRSWRGRTIKPFSGRRGSPSSISRLRWST